ncbi:5574_t:CDS:2 [Ambispora leptoticha]|uniref:Phosphodiesterase n=1 Tax=Ambispora leptoticha TaxID=144679 RepID=A0A9N9FVB8_9GLOM|nr:5574_t:CDS:2 [Ambispora leptoticha]
MLVLKHNKLSSDHLITIESTMLKFIDGKLSNTGMDFKVWDWSIPELYGILVGMFVKLNLRGTLNITTSEILDFIIEVDQGYLDTSYHSFYHAVDVVAVLYYMLTELGAGKFLTSLDCIALLIAGLCHDIGHPGLNNVYQVNAKTELAIRYKDQSVLENHSCTLTMNILTKHKLLRNVHTCQTEYFDMSPEQVDESLRSLITKTILATDMIFHYDLMENLNTMIEQTWSPSCSPENSGDESESYPNSPMSSAASSPATSPISISHPGQSSNTLYDSDNNSTRSSIIVTLDAEQRELWCKVLLHAADLSNTVRPWEISKRWSDMVVEEFFLQGDLEKKNNLPVSPNMDRKQAHQSQISLGFGDFVVKPFFEAFAAFLQPATIFLNILKDNRVYWDALSKEPQPETKTIADGKLLSTKAANNARRVSLAAGLLIIPDDIQDKMRNLPRPQRYRKLKRSLSGRSLLTSGNSNNSHLQNDGSVDDLDDDSKKPTRRKSAGPNSTLSGEVTAMLLQPPSSNFKDIKKCPPPLSSPATIPIAVPPPPSTTTNNSSNQNYNSNSHSHNDNNSTSNNTSYIQRRIGRVRRSSSLDQNMIRQITAYYGTGGDIPPMEQRAVVAGS